MRGKPDCSRRVSGFPHLAGGRVVLKDPPYSPRIQVARTMPLLSCRTLRVALAVSALGLFACGDQGPVILSDTLTVLVVSPNGSEGSAIVSLVGAGLGQVTATDGLLFEERTGDGVRVMLINDEPGPLQFRVEVADTTLPLRGTVEEIAGPDDRVRTANVGYSVSFLR